MLVLSRKHRESVVVGSPDGVECLVKVTVLEINRGKVKLGFEVDKVVPVNRGEVWERLYGAGKDNGGIAANALGVEIPNATRPKQQ